jgi:hypothetical protein
MSAFVPRSPAEVWANLSRLYPIYTALSRESAIESEPCLELVEAIKVPSAEMIAEAEKWFAGMDEKIQIQHLRQFVQTSSLVNDAVLRDLLVHNLNKPPRGEHDRDKVDFLLVQLFSEQAPAELSDADFSLEATGKILEPVMGPVEIKEPELLNALNDLLHEAEETKTLNLLFTARVIERGRQIKESCGDRFFEPLTMVAFARFGFLMRRTFFRLMHQDLNAILDGLRELESRGLSTLDCRKAQFSAEEPVSRLRLICQSWKVMFHAEYSAGQPLCILVDLRTAVEAGLRESAGASKVRAAGAGAGGASTDGEFGVSAGSNADDGSE